MLYTLSIYNFYLSYIKIQTQFKVKIANQSEQTKFQLKNKWEGERSRREGGILKLGKSWRIMAVFFIKIKTFNYKETGS